MRMTRAAQRAIEVEQDSNSYDDPIAIHEDSDLSKQDGLEIDETTRPALKDITDVENSSSATIEELDDMKQSVGGKKAKSSKKRKGTRKQTTNQEETLERPIEETVGTATQEPVFGAISMEVEEPEQLDTEPQSSLLEQNTTVDTSETTEEASSASPAAPTSYDKLEEAVTHVQTPTKRPVSAPTKTPKFDPEIHVSTGEGSSSQDTQEDSFIGSIKCRSPIKLSREPSHESMTGSIGSAIMKRRASRIEDSVEAIDALEDAIEQLSGSLPKLESHLEIPDSPVKTKTPLPPSARKTALETVVSAKNDAKTSPSKTKDLKTSPLKTKVTAIKSAPIRTTSGRVSSVKPVQAPVIKKSTSRPSTFPPKPKPAARPSTMPPKTQAQAAEPKQMSFSQSPLKKPSPSAAAANRVSSGQLSTSRPGFVPQKSSKRLTTSNFALPGEAIAAKLKAQRDERQKAEEEAAKKPAFKARPAPKTVVSGGRPSVVPRENRASQARMSAIGRTVSSSSEKENVAPKPSASLTVNRSRPVETKANTTARRATANPPITNSSAPKPATTSSKSAPRTSIAPRVAALSAGAKPPPTPNTRIRQEAKGREVFARTQTGLKKQADEKREKEEAAKKARADAAERGRQASREWAEKQKAKQERLAALKKLEGGEKEQTVSTPTQASAALAV